MAQYRKKPVVIEAFQLLKDHTNLDPAIPAWFVDAVHQGTARAESDCVKITTLEGEMRAEIGDWIIQGVKLEIYPCKPDIFAATYDPVEPGDNLTPPKYSHQL